MNEELDRAAVDLAAREIESVHGWNSYDRALTLVARAVAQDDGKARIFWAAVAAVLAERIRRDGC